MKKQTFIKFYTFITLPFKFAQDFFKSSVMVLSNDANKKLNEHLRRTIIVNVIGSDACPSDM